MNRRVRLLVAASNTLIRRGLVSLLETEKNFRVIGQAEDGEEVLSLCPALFPDLAILDAGLFVKDGFQTAAELKALSPELSIILLLDFGTRSELARAEALDPAAIVLKGTAENDLLKAVQEVVQGRRYQSPDLRGALSKSK